MTRNLELGIAGRAPNILQAFGTVEAPPQLRKIGKPASPASAVAAAPL